MSILVVDVFELRRSSAVRRTVDTTVTLDDVVVGERQVVEGRVDVAVEVRAIGSDIVAEGWMALVARVPCRRCLSDVDEAIDVDLREIFQNQPTEGETWPIDDERIDLEPVVREAALLALPLVPLCADDCPGPEPERFPTGPGDDVEGSDADGAEAPRDRRWAALDELDLG